MIKRFKNKRGRGFTLIELLIVIAIILILIAIALPNFLEAQIRARVTKAKGEIRSLYIAQESYFLDWDTYPAENERDETSRFQRGLFWLTSPIAYITSIPEDPFGEFTSDSDDTTFITYETGGIEEGLSRPECGICMATWVIMSNGPDGQQLISAADAHFDAGGLAANYAPTNGSKSRGSIYHWGGDPYFIGVGLSQADKTAAKNPATLVGRTVDGIVYMRRLPPKS